MTLAILAWGLTALVGVLGSAMCSGIETGLYRVGRVRLAARAGATPPIPRARALAHELDHSDRALTTLLIANNAFNYLGSLGIAGLLSLAALGDGAIIVLQALVLTPLLLVFAESLPKEVFRQSADRLGERFAFALVAMRYIATLTLVLPLVLLAARAVSGLLRVPRSRAFGSGRERVVSLIQHASAEGAFSGVQSSLADRALAFGAARVVMEMVPWGSVHAIPLGSPREVVERLFRRTGRSRYPVTDRTGRVVGVLEQLDVHLNPGAPIGELLHDAPRVAPSETARDALVAIRASGAGMAIVERHGRPIGIVTPKDLIEPLVGELESW